MTSPAQLLWGCLLSTQSPGTYWHTPKDCMLLHLTCIQCKAATLGHFQWEPVARGDVPTSTLLDSFEWGQGWCARSVPEYSSVQKAQR